MVEEAISESQVLPHVHFLAKQPIVFEFGLILYKIRIECALWNSDKLVLLCKHVQSSESLWDTRRRNHSLLEPEVRVARNQPDECLFAADDFLDEA